MGIHKNLIKPLDIYAESIIARLAEIETRLNELSELPRADASIWQRVGKSFSTYYLVHRTTSPRYKSGESKRRERIGRGERAKQVCERQIQRMEECKRLSEEQVDLERAYANITYHLRAAINATGNKQPDDEQFHRRYS